MKTEEFRKWLEESGKSISTIRNRISNCRNVENFEGNLDIHFSDDYGLSLIKKLSYSKKDEINQEEPKHRIQINGNLRTGSATLKQAVKLYFLYREKG